MRLRRQELGAMAWSSDESDDDEEAQKRDEENRTALFRRQPSSLETRSQKARGRRVLTARTRSWSEALARADGGRARAPARRDRAAMRSWRRALAASKGDRGGRGVTSGEPALPEDMAMSSEDEELEVREHPEFSPQKLALYDDLDRSRRSASPILRVPSPAGGALLSEASIKRAQQSSRASSPRMSEAFANRRRSSAGPRRPSPAIPGARAPRPTATGPRRPSPDARPPPPPWQGDASPGSFEARRFSGKLPMM